MKTRNITQFALAGLIALTPQGSQAQTPAPPAKPAPIKVVLNGTPLTFTGTPPMQVKGSTLVPMRGIFEALGATVKFDKASQTVYGQKGATAVVLPVGALTATVNGQPQTLPVPAELISGTTLVPLRFISESLGATVVWDPILSTVSIQTVDQHVAELPVVPGNTTIHGEVTGLYTNTTPTQLTVRVGGQNTTVPLSNSTIILRSVTDKAAIEVPLADIKPGDQVTVQRGDGGVATIVTATFGQVKGTIVSIGHQPNGNAALTLDSGRVVELVPGTPITFDGSAVALSDLKPYEVVVIRTNNADSLGYGVAVSTANNPNPTPPGAAPAPAVPAPAPAPGASILSGSVSSVEVTSLTKNPQRPLRAGDVLKVTLSGTPGGRGIFAIPGVVDTVPMREASAGVYVGSYPISKNATARNAAVLGRLLVGGVQSVLVQAPGTLTIDTQPPKLTDFGPPPGAVSESAQPFIYATLSDGAGTGVNQAATRLLVDGRDVTANANVTGAFVTYLPPAALAGGMHTATVSASDRAGNSAAASWSFQTAPSRLIRSFASNEPEGSTVSAGSIIVFVLTAAPGGKAQASIGGLGRKIPLKETETSGQYIGEYTVKAGDAIEDAPVAARFVASDGTVITKNLSAGLTLTAGPPPAPRIAFPKDADYVDETAPLAVRGRAQSGSTVRVTLSYVSQAPGGILPVQGESGTKDVTADKNGEWEVTDLPLLMKTLIGKDRDTAFTITAVQLDAGGNPASATSTVHVRPG